MILSIGEILVDMVGENNNDGLTFKAFVGGAPFNVAVNAKQAGAEVFPFYPIRDDYEETYINNAVEYFKGKDFDAMVLCVAGWIPTHAMLIFKLKNSCGCKMFFSINIYCHLCK